VTCDSEFSRAKFCEEARDGIGAEFLKRGIELGGGATSIDAIFKIEGVIEPLIEGEAIDGRSGIPAGEKNPTGGEAEDTKQEDYPEVQAGFWDSEFRDVEILCKVRRKARGRVSTGTIRW
jgi:hypothetical protein